MTPRRFRAAFAWTIFLAFLAAHMVDKIARGVAACMTHEIACPLEALR